MSAHFNNNLKKAKEQSELKEKELRAEPFQVEILLPSQPNIIRLTYKNINSPILLAIEELDLDGKPLTYSSIKGRKIEGNVPTLLLELVPLFRIKPTSWYHNPECYLESYYKQH